MDAPGVPQEIATEPDTTNVVSSMGANVGVATIDWITNNSVEDTAESRYKPDFAAIARMVTVPAVANVTLPPDNTVEAVLGVEPSVV